jgi:hypothetical protein
VKKAPVCWCLLLLVSAPVLHAQGEFVGHVSTAIPEMSRFEIVQSTLVVRSTFRIDKFSGAVDQLVLASDSSLVWQQVPRIKHPAGNPTSPERVNYQLFLSGLANRHTYLMNMNNGATWQLVQTKEGGYLWEPIGG